LSPLLLFPAAVLLPAGLVWGWRRRSEPLARFALAWLAPSWLVFELAPTKLVHYPLPLYAALAWLAAGALSEPIGPLSRRLGAGLSLLAGGVLTAACLWAAAAYGGPDAWAWSVAAAVLFLAAGAAAALGALRAEPRAGLVAALALGVAGHAALGGGLLPALSALWVSDRAAKGMAEKGISPRDGLTPGPVAVAGYAEPSLVFALGTMTQLEGPAEAVEALADGRPALVEAGQAQAFREAADAVGLAAERIGEVKGFDYSEGDRVALSLWRAAPGPRDEDAPAPAFPEPANPGSVSPGRDGAAAPPAPPTPR
jgi:4-amino-4-deoxy-L-arabinose transferase-like glycosyltransferase